MYYIVPINHNKSVFYLYFFIVIEFSSKMEEKNFVKILGIKANLFIGTLTKDECYKKYMRTEIITDFDRLFNSTTLSGV